MSVKKTTNAIAEAEEITALKTELSELKKVFNAVVESSISGYWDWNVTTNEEYMSPTFKAMLGYRDEEVPNRREWKQLNIHPEDLQIMSETLHEHIETKGKHPYDNEVRYFHKNGSVVWVYCKGEVIEWDEEDKPLRMVGSYVNITPLKEARGHLEQALEISKAGAWEWEIDKGQVTWDKQIHLLFGVKPNKYQNSYEMWTNCIHKEDVEREVNNVKDALKGIKPYDTSYRVVWPNGEIKHIRSKGKVIYGESNRAVKMVGMSWDITNEQFMLDALKDSEERFKLAVQGSSAGIWDWLDVNSNEEWWSPKFYELLGYQNQEIPSTVSGFTQLLHPDDIKPTFNLVDKHFAHKAPFEIEYRLKVKSGEYKWFLGSGQAEWDAEGKPRRMVGSIIDIDERKKAEALALEKTEQLKQKNQELEEFVFVASHDLQEPVRTISGFMDLFTDNYKDKLDEDGIQCLQFIKGATERSRDLIKDLLDYSRLGNQKETVEIDLNKVVADVQVDLFAQIKEKEASIKIDQLPTIYGLETEIRLLFQNLIGNAIKFSKRDEKPLVTISCKKDGSNWQFSIADNGIGFDPKNAETVFVIFKQLNSKKDYKGTGIGLAHCKRIIELHQGKIWAESEVGKGSTFYFTIPTKMAN